MCRDGLCEHHAAQPAAGPEDGATAGFDRRRLLMAAATGAALTLAPVSFGTGSARAATGTPKGSPTAGGEVSRVVTGHLETGAAVRSA
jgi:hypothetical protein